MGDMKEPPEDSAEKVEMTGTDTRSQTFAHRRTVPAPPCRPRFTDQGIAKVPPGKSCGGPEVALRECFPRSLDRDVPKLIAFANRSWFCAVTAEGGGS